MEWSSRFQKLVSHNQDIRRLVDRGYAITFDSGWMIIRDVPYLGPRGELKWGALATKLVPIDDARVTQEDHTVLFAGSVPHEIDGTPIPRIAAGEHQLVLSAACSDVIVERRFSNKPRSGAFVDFYAKIESYVSIISGPAMHLHGVTPLSFHSVPDSPAPSVLKVQDSLTSKAEIADLSDKLRDDVVAVIGLGGTGAYLVDFLAKTPIKEIRGFDLDDFHVHNALRSPGRLDPEELGLKKAAVYAQRYDSLRHGLRFEPRNIDDESDEDLDGVTFAFVCVDKGSSRAAVFKALMRKKIPFIDVGMGLHRRNGSLAGMARVTYFPADAAASVATRQWAELNDAQENIYRANIQISELNALNASLAMIKFKQVRRFYVDATPVVHLLFDVSDLKIATECEG